MERNREWKQRETKVKEEEEQSGSSGPGRVKRQEVGRLMRLGAVLLTSVDARRLRCAAAERLKCTRKCVREKTAPRPLASSPLTHVNYLRPPQRRRHFALFHSFVCLFILFTRRCGRQLGILAVRRADREGLLRKVSLFWSAFGFLTANGKHASCRQTCDCATIFNYILMKTNLNNKK